MTVLRSRSSYPLYLTRGIALSVLLSFLTLAGFAVMSYLRDRDAVTQRAEREARVLAPRLASLAQQDLQQFLQAQIRLPVITNNLPQQNSSRPPTLTPLLTVSAEGQWLSPVAILELPSSPNWVAALSRQQHAQLAKAEQWSGRANIEEGVSAWREFAKIAPQEATALAAYGEILCGPSAAFPSATIRFLSNTSPQARTQAGLPLVTLAALEYLHQVKPSLESESALLLATQTALTECPSFLTPPLLDAMEQSAAQFSLSHRTAIADLRALWNRTQWVHEIAARCSRQDLAHTPAEPFWLSTPEKMESVLIVPLTDKPDPSGNQSWLPIRDAMLREKTQVSLASLRGLLPDYVGLELRLGDRILGSSASASITTSPINPTPTILSSEQTSTKWLGARMTLSLSLLLTDPNQLYAQQTRRTRLTAIYLSSMTLTALIGLGVLWRIFQHQRALAETQSNFVSSVSHELRAPVAAISLLSENLAKDEFADPLRRREYYQLIVRECRRLGSLVENVLNFSRLERGTDAFEPEPTDVVQLVTQVSGAMTPRATESQVHLTLHLPHSTVEWSLDGRAVERALTNLIDNALKHSPAGGEVRIELQRSDTLLSVSVIDQGPGIPESERQRIFEPFYRRGSELRRETRGIGIGLTLVQHIVEAHGGRVIVESQVGAGSRFTLEFPATSLKRD